LVFGSHEKLGSGKVALFEFVTSRLLLVVANDALGRSTGHQQSERQRNHQ
jgi:hypothetical protein